MKKSLRIVPPGTNIYNTFLILAGAALVFIVVFSSGFTTDFIDHVEAADLVPMPSFSELAAGRMSGFWIYAAVCAALAARFILSFRGESHSIYTLKRSKKRSIILRMSFTVPVLALIAGLLLCLLMLLYYRRFYVYYFPAGAAMPPVELDFWRALL